MAPANLLQRGDSVPHFVLSRPDGSLWDYSKTTWQRNNLLLVSLRVNEHADNKAYVDELLKSWEQLLALETTWVLTMEALERVPHPGLVIADRWGEIYFVAGSTSAAGLPRPSEILEWLRYIEHECPECQGEAR